MVEITREKHLNHMVKVVPFIVLCYAIQSFIIMKIGPGELAGISLSVLGGFLACMIAGFVIYDMNHKVQIFDDHLKIRFLITESIISMSDIESIHIGDPGESFSSLTLKMSSGKRTFFFIDNAEKIKSFIEEKKNKEFKKAA